MINASVLVVASSDKPNCVCCHTLDCTITPLLVLFQPVGLVEEDLSHCPLEQRVFQFYKVCSAPEFALIDVTVRDPNRSDIRKCCIANQALEPIRNAAEVLLCFDFIQVRFYDHPRTPCDLRSMQAMVTKMPHQMQRLPWIILSQAPSEDIPCH